MTHGSLFSGIGGFELAARWAGFTNVFSCEIEEFNQRVLKYHFPESTLYENVKEFNATQYRGRVDLITGGFPCQPYSAAGKRLGKADDRHLWPEMLRIIQEVQPRYVVGENVRGLLNWNGGLVFDEVQTDLENIGYEVTPYLLPACGVNAPHRRDRIFFVANAKNIRRVQTKNVGRERREQKPYNGKEVRRSLDADGAGRNATHSSRVGLEHGTKRRSIEGSEGKVRQRVAGHVATESKERDTTNTLRPGGRQNHRQGKAEQFDKNGTTNNWENFPTQPPVCGGDDGLPAQLDGITFSKWRKESIKSYGNAIVPHVAYELFKAIKETEKRLSSL